MFNSPFAALFSHLRAVTSPDELFWIEPEPGDYLPLDASDAPDITTIPEPGELRLVEAAPYTPVWVWSRAYEMYLPGMVLEVAPEPLFGEWWIFVSYDTPNGRKETWLVDSQLSVRVAEAAAEAAAS